jgi:hypothetical protein
MNETYSRSEGIVGILLPVVLKTATSKNLIVPQNPLILY